MRLGQVVNILCGLAPEHLAESWDHVGLQVGDPAGRIRTALLCIDLTQSVLEDAVAKRASLIVAYHPPIFSPLSAVTTLDPKQRLIYTAIRHKIAIYSPHTALDAAAGGVNDWLCDGIGRGDRRPIKRIDRPDLQAFKLVVFVPHGDADKLRLALSEARAGVIGDYTECSFGVHGRGTFRGGDSTNPTIGKRGRFETVEELRMEMVCPADHLRDVVAALYRVHPYEEPAFDLYRLEPPPRTVSCSEVGQGRVVRLDQPISPSTLIRRIKKHLGVDRLEVAQPPGLKQVTRIGLCAGAGGSLVDQAGDIDAFITGEMRHHGVLEALVSGVMVILAGHTQTERPYLSVYRQRIIEAGGDPVEWLISDADEPPLRWR